MKLPRTFEKAIIVKNLKEAEAFASAPYSMAYVGDEGCEHAMPSPKDMRSILDLLQKRKMSFAWVIPPASDKTLARIEEIARSLGKRGRCEIIVNDLGILERLQRFPSVTLTAGRLLVRQLASPETSLFGKKDTLDYLKSRRVGRIDVSFLPSMAWPRTPKDLDISLVYPFYPVALTRLCFFKRDHKKPSCRQECRARRRTLSHPFFRDTLTLAGNAFFLKFPISGEVLNGRGISRVVRQP